MTQPANQPIMAVIEDPPHRRAEEETAKVSRFEAIADLLREARMSCMGEGDESLIFMVDAAYRICQACCCAWNEVERHREAYFAGLRRQTQLLQELSVFINMISMPSVGGKYRQPSFSGLSDTDQDQSVIALHNHYERLVENIRDLLAPLSTSVEFSPRDLPVGENGDEPGIEPTPQNGNPPVKTSFEQTLIQEEGGISAIQPGPSIEETGHSAKISQPSLAVYFLSPFRVLLDEQPVAGWPNCKGKSIFKYLVTHRERPISKEVLMEIFWPEGDPDAARNNLNVAIYGLRKSLGKVNADYSYVLFQDGCYLLNPEVGIWVDTEAFMAHVRKAKEYERRNDLVAAIHEFRAAEAIYQSEFLVEDRYEDWLLGARQTFHDTYLAVMNRLSCYYLDVRDYEACVTICVKTLAHDSCNEELHQRLMRCYSLMGQAHLAMRQFHLCRETLARDLNLKPSQETMQLFEQIRQRQSV